MAQSRHITETVSHYQSGKSPVFDEVFREAVDRFSTITKDKRKISLAEGATDLRDIQELVADALDDYSKKSKWPKARKRLKEVAATVHHYSTTLDVLAQHHPEYVALAWGTMKLLLTSFLQHEQTITTLAEALVQIAKVLPKIELSMRLYPTAQMKDAVVDLYVHILRFFIRAHNWYKEGSFRRALHSVTRPPELRYGDILSTIQECTRSIERLSALGSQAELRAVHTQVTSVAQAATSLTAMVQANALNLDALNSTVGDLLTRVINTQALHSSALLDTNQRLSEIELGQILASIDTATFEQQATIFEYHLALARHRGQSASGFTTNPFWTSPRLKHWSHSPVCDLAIVKGSFQSRLAVRDFAVEVIDQLQSSQVPVFWALKPPPDINATPKPLAATSLLKLLVMQALRANQLSRTEKSLAVICAQVRTACTEHEWFQVLESALDGVAPLRYLVIDLQALDPVSQPGGLNWCQEFLSYFASQASRPSSGRIKVLLTGCRAYPSIGASDPQIMDRTIQVRAVKTKRKARVAQRFRATSV